MPRLGPSGRARSVCRMGAGRPLHPDARTRTTGSRAGRIWMASRCPSSRDQQAMVTQLEAGSHRSRGCPARPICACKKDAKFQVIVNEQTGAHYECRAELNHAAVRQQAAASGAELCRGSPALRRHVSSAGLAQPTRCHGRRLAVPTSPPRQNSLRLRPGQGQGRCCNSRV